MGRSAAGLCGLDETSGKIALTDAFSVWAGMPRKKLLTGLEELTGKPCVLDDPQRAAVLASSAFSLCGLKAACLCTFHLGRLRSIEIHPVGGTAADQRRLLFQLIGIQDPCLETMQGVLKRYAFGTAWIDTDPRSGDAALRLTYAVKE
jgi:hypothetical protein